MAEEKAGKGTVIKISDGASSPTFTAIPKISSGPTGPEIGMSLVEYTTHDVDAPGKKPTFKSIGPVQFSVLYDSSDTQHAQLMSSARAGTRCDFQHVMTDTGAEQYDYSGYVKMNPSGEKDGMVEYSVEIEIDGDVTPS